MVCYTCNPNQPVTQVQLWLRALVRTEGRTPLPPVDGVYSEETAAAVRQFQAARGLPATGVVDYGTWAALQAAGEPLCDVRPVPLYVDCPEAGPGAAGGNIFIVQAMLNALSPHFGNFPLVAYTGEYDAATQEAVSVVQRVSGLREDGIIDLPTWNALAELYNANQGRIPLDWQRSMQP